MVGKYKVITLCGSTKFKEQYLEAQKRLTLEGTKAINRYRMIDEETNRQTMSYLE